MKFSEDFYWGGAGAANQCEGALNVDGRGMARTYVTTCLLYTSCNCNVEICNALRTSQLFNTPNMSRSAYVAHVEKDKCVALSLIHI